MITQKFNVPFAALVFFLSLTGCGKSKIDSTQNNNQGDPVIKELAPQAWEKTLEGVKTETDSISFNNGMFLNADETEIGFYKVFPQDSVKKYFCEDYPLICNYPPDRVNRYNQFSLLRHFDIGNGNNALLFQAVGGPSEELMGMGIFLATLDEGGEVVDAQILNESYPGKKEITPFEMFLDLKSLKGNISTGIPGENGELEVIPEGKISISPNGTIEVSKD